MTHLVYICFLCQLFLSVFGKCTTKPCYLMFKYFQNLGRLVQVSGNNSVNCPNEPAVFICSDNFVNWEIQPGIGFTPYSNGYNTQHNEDIEQTFVIKSVEVVFRTVYKNESFIVVQLTISTPIPLNGSTIGCNDESIQLIVTRKISTFNSQLK